MAVHQSSWRRLMYAQRQCTRIICAAINLIFTFFLFIQLLSVSLPLGYSLWTLLQRCLVYIFSGLFNTHSNDSRHSYLKFGVRSVICCFSVLAWRVALQFSSAMHFQCYRKVVHYAMPRFGIRLCFCGNERSIDCPDKCRKCCEWRCANEMNVVAVPIKNSQETKQQFV